ncbi:MAG: glycoside hydrolase family 5 protein, partial [Candidatus Omnitrophica bacterium]|nr:glycoside hydrolase family 5 protein [Candidatus Omnitrophota bacterium]
DHYFRRMRENLENYIRMWMGAWWVGIEWTPAYAQHYEGLGRYSLENSWKIDYVLDIARENGIYIVLTLINHGQFSIRPDAEWWDNPYNVINGGFLNSPDEFFYSEEAEKRFAKRLRYIVARWGYSTQIAFWELWNEVDLTGYYDSKNVRQWHEKIIPILKEMDPWKHNVTSHICRPHADPMVWAARGLETLVSNAYSSTIVDTLREYYFKRKPFGKPMQVHEFGVGRNAKQLENNLHGGIWASSLSPMLGTALFWWWPFIDKKDLYFHYKAVAKFLEGLDRRGKNFQFSTARIVSASGERLNKVGVTGIQNENSAYLWVYDSSIFNSRTPVESAEIIEGTRLFIDIFKPGLYNIEFWDTYKGEKFSSFEKEFSSGECSIELCPFSRDFAIKIEGKK